MKVGFALTMIRKCRFSLACFIVLAGALALTGCGVTVDKEQDFPTYGSDKYSREAKGRLTGGDETVFGELSLGGDSKGRRQGESFSTVNYYLWRATLETLDLGPLESADPFGGVIITDWYAPPETPDHRFKANIYILDRRLRSDGVRVALFHQRRDSSGQWVDAQVHDQTATKLEDAILTRARQLRVGAVR